MKEDNPKTRVSLDVSPSLNKRLETLERLTQADSKASVIRHAIQVYEYIVKKTSEGYTFKVSYADGEEETLVFISPYAFDHQGGE